jgi:hypothetical protein
MRGFDSWFIGTVVGALASYAAATIALGAAPHELLHARRIGRALRGTESENGKKTGGVR